MTAARIGISEREFWSMLPREFVRRCAVYREQQEARGELEKHRFYNMLNAFGSAMAGKKWKWQSPPSDARPVEGFEDREARVLKRVAERRRRRHGI